MPHNQCQSTDPLSTATHRCRNKWNFLYYLSLMKFCQIYLYRWTYWPSQSSRFAIIKPFWFEVFPAGTQRNNNVFITSKRRRRRRFDVMKTLSLRHYCVMCPLGLAKFVPDSPQNTLLWAWESAVAREWHRFIFSPNHKIPNLLCWGGQCGDSLMMKFLWSATGVVYHKG